MRLGDMFEIIIGVAAIVLGLNAFSPSGLPWTRQKNLTGNTAKILGVVCILIGIGFFAMAAMGLLSRH